MNSTIDASGSGHSKLFLDSTQVPMSVIDPSDGKTARPWLVAVMDDENRVLGHEVLLRKPSAEDAARIVKEASKKKKKRGRK